MVGLYFDGIKQLIRGRIGFDIIRFLNFFRIPWIYFYEKNFLKKVDFIHVQTMKEKNKLQFILGKNTPKIFNYPNGKINQISSFKKKNFQEKYYL